MKESGIDWIGQIPEEWEVTRIKNIVSIERGASPRPIDKFISDDDTGVNWIRIGDTYKGNKYITSTKLKITNRGKQFSRYIHPGTLILSNSMSFGEPYISSIYGCIHDGWLSLAPYKNISKEYLYWLLLSDVCTSQFNLVSIGAVVENLSVDKVGNTLVSMPYSLSEQQKIADFLDKKTAQLDKAKALLEEQIQKLKDYRASLIYETVTKGLDKTVPMKDSGIDWIGQIPQGWGVIKFKHLGDVKQGLTYSPSDIVDKDEGILVLRSGNIQNGILDFNNNVYVKTKVAESILLRKNDILITARNGSSALIGKNAIIDTDIKATFGAFMMVFRANKSLFAKFAFYLMNVSFNFYRTFFTTSTVNQLTAAIFNGIEVPLPSIYEQKKITDFLDGKTVQIDKLIQIKNQQIENINKQRQTLIYDYVTGKRRV
jgi:putative type I restriction-modification system specificity determinant for hsdM and hsdR (hsdS)